MVLKQLRRAGVGAASLLCAAVVSLVGASAGEAVASINVPCLAGGPGVVAAVNAANAAGGGTINLGVGCVYAFLAPNNQAMGGNALPVVVTPITINGSRTTIAGIFGRFRIIEIDGTRGGALTLNGVTLKGGRSTGPGGGIFNVSGTLTLNHSTVLLNSSAQAGGGIASGFGATTVLNDSEVSWNTVPTNATGMGGGGIVSLASDLTLNHSIVDHNTGPGGGGIASGNGMGGGPGSTITLTDSVISDNTATGVPESGGGGISNGGTLVSTNSEIVGNTAPGETGGGLLNHARATLNQTVVSGNSAPTDNSGNPGLGGGIVNAIFFAGQPTPTLVLNESQVTGNSATDGGGIVNISFDPTVPAGTVTLNNSTVTGNTPENCLPPGSIAGCAG